MEISLRSYINSIDSYSDLKLQSHYIIINNESISDNYESFEGIGENRHMHFICDYGIDQYNKYITLLNFKDHGEMLDFVPEVLEKHSMQAGDDFIYGTMMTPEAYAHTKLLNEQPNWIISRLTYSNTENDKIPDSIFVNHVNLLTDKCKKKKLKYRSPQQVENAFNRYYFNKKYKKALSELLKGTGIQVPDIKNSNSR